MPYMVNDLVILSWEEDLKVGTSQYEKGKLELKEKLECCKASLRFQTIFQM